MGGQRPRDPRPGQPATDTTKPNQKKPKGIGVGTPHQRQHPHTPAPRAAPQEGRGQAGHTHDRTHTPTTPPQGEAGRSRNPDPNTHAHTTHQNRERRGSGGARTQPTRPKTVPRTGGVQADTHSLPQTPRTPAGKRGAKPQTVPKHTHPRPQPGLAGLLKPKPKRNPDPSTNATQQ